MNRNADDRGVARPVISGGRLLPRRKLQRLADRCLVELDGLRTADTATLRERYAALSAQVRSQALNDPGSADPGFDDEALVTALALAARAASITVGLSPFPVQVLAALAAATGNIVEMDTGEGKTLAIGLAAVALALPDRGVHVATANDYLAARDAKFVAPLAALFGLDVGVCDPTLDPQARRPAYACSITYGTARVFGYDYLHDNLVQVPGREVARQAFAVLLDEADSVLLDDATTPVTVATPTGSRIAFDRYTRAVDTLAASDVHLDEPAGLVALLESGLTKVADALGVDELYRNPEQVRRLQAALNARFLYREGVDFLVVDGTRRSVVLVDPRTGRPSTSRLGAGLHEALENRLGLTGGPVSVVRGQVSVYGLFSRYRRLGGMSGTALACIDEFDEHYGRRVYRVPPNVECRRVDHPDRIFATAADRLAALRDDVVSRNMRGQPVLVLAESVERCEEIGSALADLPDVRVLSARNPHDEAETIMRAGEPGAVTVATLMAGRGVDIIVGGDPTGEGFVADRAAALSAGGLAVVSTCRFPARRFDRQVRGRSGRQGEPGESQFFLSFDDDLVKRYAPAAMRTLLDQGSELPTRVAGRVFDNAQLRVEAETSAARRASLRLDRVLDGQRTEFYGYRRKLVALAAWPRTGSVLRAALEGRRHRFDGDPVALAGPAWTAALAPSTSPDVDALAATMLADVRRRLGLLANVDAVDRLMLLEELLGARVLDCLDLAWAEHLQAVNDLRGASRMAARFGQRPDRVLKASLARSFAAVPARFHDLALVNLAGLTLNKLTRIDAPSTPVDGASSHA